jgi:TPR repeat protein
MRQEPESMADWKTTMKKMKSLSIVTLLAAGIAWLPMVNADEITECDRLVSHPLDPDRITDGVYSSAVDHAAGIAACEAAVENDPGNARLRYQLGRVLFYNGQEPKAMPHVEFAAGAGYRQAQFVLGYILEGGRGGADQDMCRAADLWLKSARAGRLAALISYPHHVARGHFDNCDIDASNDEMRNFLKQAGQRKLDYYQTVLLGDVEADLAAYLEAN